MRQKAPTNTPLVSSLSLGLLLVLIFVGSTDAKKKSPILVKAGCGQPCNHATECVDHYCTRCIDPLTNKTLTSTTRTGYCVRGLETGQICGANTDCFPWNTNGSIDCVLPSSSSLAGKPPPPHPNKKCTETKSSKSAAVGYIGAAIAVCFFGSNFVPVKKFETGDGLFFQWVVCLAIWISGFILFLVRGMPHFQPYAMVGGAMWCTGNVSVVPIVKCIGLGLGLCLWGSTNMLAGWASGMFGLFEVTINRPKHLALNIVGIVLALCATGCFSMVSPKVDDDEDEEDQAVRAVNELSPLAPEVNAQEDNASWEQKLSPATRRIFGVVASLVAGLFYGLNFDPPTYLQENAYRFGLNSKIHYSNQGLDYVFSHFTGIFLTSSFYFICYCIFKRNNPKIYPKVVLPALASGFLWAIADIGWFIANENLSLVVSFPIVCLGPGLVGSLWGIFLFKEIQGRRNFIFLGAAFALTAGASALISVSKK